MKTFVPLGFTSVELSRIFFVTVWIANSFQYLRLKRPSGNFGAISPDFFALASSRTAPTFYLRLCQSPPPSYRLLGAYLGRLVVQRRAPAASRQSFEVGFGENETMEKVWRHKKKWSHFRFSAFRVLPIYLR